MKYILLSTFVISLVFGAAVIGNSTQASNGDYAITITNVSKTILTPPILATVRRDNARFFEVGESASVALEHLAEGGDTSQLKEFFEDRNASVVEHNAPILPGESVTINVSGRSNSSLYIASMLLPTNDAFIGLNGMRLRDLRKLDSPIQLMAYDAGTETNTEDCDDIPGPQCGGEGFNSDRDDVNFIHPHAGIHGEGELDISEYNWENPVALVTVERI